MKRFWTRADAVRGPGGWGVTLDRRPVNTPGRAPLKLPGQALAHAVADEWNGVGDTIDPRAMPLTGLANAAIDRIAPNAEQFAAGLAAYAASDLVCYRATDPAALIDRQEEAWDPPLAWAQAQYDVRFQVTQGVMHVDQPPVTVIRLGAAVVAMDAFHLAALSPLVTTTGSLVLALWLVEGGADPQTVWSAAMVDEDWQEERWGKDNEAEQARAARRADFDAGVRFLQLIRSQ
ncbi:ATP12 family chaperone protein [Sphingomonas sp. FW199]|uniref:ATP12 family chaperone protein n=1 Tax=Sphingomonas sp. FW199 TaxID=3400217 RepID=UPI003CE75C15